MSEPQQGAEGDVIAQRHAADNLAAIDSALQLLLYSNGGVNTLARLRQVLAITRLVKNPDS